MYFFASQKKKKTANKRSRMNTIFAVAFVFQVICILSLFGVVNIPAIASLVRLVVKRSFAHPLQTGISGLISLICVIVFIATADDAYLSCERSASVETRFCKHVFSNNACRLW